MNWAVHPSSFILHPFATVAFSSAGLADHSGGPATELHRFPYSPRRARGTCRYSKDRLYQVETPRSNDSISGDWFSFVAVVRLQRLRLNSHDFSCEPRHYAILVHASRFCLALVNHPRARNSERLLVVRWADRVAALLVH